MPNGHTEAAFRFPVGGSHSSAPNEVAYKPLQQIRVSGGRLLRPLILTVEETEDGQTVVADELLSSYGVGDTVEEAVDEFLEMLFDYYSELHQSRDELSRFLLRQLRVLEYFLGPLH